MSHPEQQAFLALVAAANGHLISGCRVLEIGSFDVNGSVRRYFEAADEYIGVDLVEGPGVDRVMHGHEVADPDSSFTVTLSGECFEHDSHWRDTFRNMVRLTKPGGLVTFTCASLGRPEHGTRRTNPDLSPGTQSIDSDYYRNLNEVDFEDLPLQEWFDRWKFWYQPTSLDLYFVGMRGGGSPGGAAFPDEAAVRALSALMPLPQRILRWPLRLASRHGEGPHYQDLILLYWRLVLRSSSYVARAANLRTRMRASRT